jgi:hypothetical protein
MVDKFGIWKELRKILLVVQLNSYLLMYYLLREGDEVI